MANMLKLKSGLDLLSITAVAKSCYPSITNEIIWYMHLFIFHLHEVDGMNLFLMFAEGGCIVKTFPTHRASDRYF